MRYHADTVEEFWNKEILEKCTTNSCVDSQRLFCEELANFLGAKESVIHLVPSARKGLELLLRNRLDPRRVVMVPAFNCSVVQDAITSSGYQILRYDFSPKVGGFDWESVIREMGQHVGALIVTHYFGVPIDFRPVLSHCTKHGITVIEDCAHTLGGMIANQSAGTLGDASIFSFNYDKPISLGWGGAFIINKKNMFNRNLFDHDERNTLAPNEELFIISKFMHTMKNRRRLISLQGRFFFRFLKRIGLVKNSIFTPPPFSIGRVQAELGRWCLSQYSDILTQRVANATHFAQEVNQPTWPVGLNITPAWLKQKIFLSTKDALFKASRYFQDKGIRAGNFNWPKLIDGHSQHSPSNAFQAANFWIDIPIHQNINEETISAMIEYFNMHN